MTININKTIGEEHCGHLLEVVIFKVYENLFGWSMVSKRDFVNRSCDVALNGNMQSVIPTEAQESHTYAPT